MFCCVVGWQFVNTFDLKYTRELLHGGAVLHTCRCETLQMQSERVEADGFSHGLAEADVNQTMVINLFRLALSLILLTVCGGTIASKGLDQKEMEYCHK